MGVLSLRSEVQQKENHVNDLHWITCHLFELFIGFLAFLKFSSDLDCRDTLRWRGKKGALILGGFYCLFSNIYDVLAGNGSVYFFFIKPAKF